MRTTFRRSSTSTACACAPATTARSRSWACSESRRRHAHPSTSTTTRTTSTRSSRLSRLRKPSSRSRSEAMSGLEDLYREIILDHYRAPRNRGELPVPPAHKAEGFNPLCGDEVILYLEVDGDTVTDLKIAGQGCSISQASTSMMSSAVKGKSVPEGGQLIRPFKGLLSDPRSKAQR